VQNGERLSQVFWRFFVGAWGVVVVAVLALALYRLRDVMVMFTISGLLAYLLAAPTDWLAKRSHRPVAVGIVFIFFAVGVLGLFGSFLPILYTQGRDLANKLPELLRTIGMAIDQFSADNLAAYNVDINLDQSIQNVLDQIQRGAPQILNNVFNYTQTILSSTAGILAGMVFVPMMTLYLMLDTVRLRAAFLLTFPEHHREEVDTALSAVSASLSGYIRSRVLLALFIFVTYLILFSILGVPFGILLSVLAFVSEFIPVVGWWIAFVPIVAITLLSDNPYAVIWVIIGITVLQLIQNYVLAPKLISDTMDIHPLTVVLAMLIGGAIGGGIGLLLAVPVAAAGKAVLTQFFWKDNLPAPAPSAKPAVKKPARK